MPDIHFISPRPAVVSLLLVLVGLTLQAEEADLIISADYVVTVDQQNRVLEDAAVAVKDGVIIDIDDTAKIEQRFSANERLHGKGRVLMPGLINGHTHAAMTLFRGMADDLPLMDWLTKYIFPAEIRFVDAEFVRVGTQLACLEMIKGGTTTFVDMYFHPLEIAAVVEECGLRAVIGAAVIEQESGYTRDFTDAMNKAEDFIEQWQDKNPRITPAIAAHAAYTIGPENLQIVRARANALGVPISMHVSESQAELAIIAERYQNTPVQHLEDLNFFSGPTIAAHVVWPTDAEMQILAQRRVGVIHNPTSNLKIASGMAPVPELLAAGVPVGLGTDGAASNNDLDMWEEMRLAAFLHKGRLLDPKIMPAAEVVRMATADGAHAIGLEAVGALAKGQAADMIQVALGAAHLVPLYDVVSHLAYAVDAQDVQSVIVAGRILMRERRVLSLDEAAVLEEAKTIAAEINQEIVEAQQD